MSLPCVALTREGNLPRITTITLRFNEDSDSVSRGGTDFPKSHGCLEKLTALRPVGKEGGDERANSSVSHRQLDM